MTITMNLELEIGICFKEIESVFSTVSAGYTIEDGYLKGNFKYSNAYFVFRCFSAPDDVAAEGANANWKVGMSGAFHCPASSLLESSIDIKSFLTALAVETDFNFVLSFQYESLYVVRDGSGIVFLKSMID